MIKKISKILGLTTIMICSLIGVLISCAPVTFDSSTTTTTTATVTLEGNSWKASKFRGASLQIDVSGNNLVYIFNNGNGVLKTNNVISGDGFTYSINVNQVTISGASEEALPDGTYYYWILDNILYFNETPSVATGSYPIIEFIKQ